MIESIYALTTALPITCAALGSGIGQGLIGWRSLQAIDIQPQAAQEIRKIALVGMALTETSAILGLVISMIMLFNTTTPIDCAYAIYGRFGICCAIGITSLVAGIASSMPAQISCSTVANQPFFSNKILQFMLLTQSIIMTCNVFGFIVALLIESKVNSISNIHEGLQYLAAGLSIGIGSIGPCIGLSLFAISACTAIGINRKAYAKIVPFTFVCEGMIETPIIFSLLISLLILFKVVINPAGSDIQGIVLISAAICMGLSTLGTGISAGKIGYAACEQIAHDPSIYSIISKTALLALAMIDTFAIYGTIIAITLIQFAL